MTSEPDHFKRLRSSGKKLAVCGENLPRQPQAQFIIICLSKDGELPGAGRIQPLPEQLLIIIENQLS